MVSRTEDLRAALSDAGPGAVTWFQSPELTVQGFVWPSGVITPPHEHRMWAVIRVADGQEDNTLWRRTPEGVEQRGDREVGAGDVLVLDTDAVHAVANPCRSATLALHVYGGDIITTPRREWDLRGRHEEMRHLCLDFFESELAGGVRVVGRPSCG